MLAGELENQVDQVWNAFWSGGMANALEAIQQITYLVFPRALDSEHDCTTCGDFILAQRLARVLAC